MQADAHDTGRPSGAWDLSQAGLYAEELQQHFLRVRQLEEELKRQNLALVKSLRELKSLNDLFRQHLQEREELMRAYQRLAGTPNSPDRDSLADPTLGEGWHV